MALPTIGEMVAVTWGDRSTSATVVYTTPEVLLLDGELPRGSVPPIGAPVRVTVRGRRSAVSGRLAATGRARRYLVSLGLRPVRRSPRYRVDLPVDVTSSALPGPARARIVNLSRSGARLRDLDVPVGTDLQLSFTPPGNPGPVDVRAVVVRALGETAPRELGVALRLGVLWFGPAGEDRRHPRHPTTVFKSAAPPRAPSPLPAPAPPSATERQPAASEEAGPSSPRPGRPAVAIGSAIGGPSVGSLGVTASVKPGALCSITYVTPGGAVSRAKGLTPRVADEDGRVSWVWAVSPHTRRGVGQVVIACEGQSSSIRIHVE